VSGEPTPVERLKALLALDPLDLDLYLGDPGPGEGRLFGGLVAAQSVVAAGLTVEDRALHSLHAYFLRPGRHDVPLRFVVHRIRDGRSFTTRRVVAHQGGEAIFNLSASFVRPEPGIEHQDAMPAAPAPEGLPSWEDVRARRTGEPPRPDRGPVEVLVARDETGSPSHPPPPRWVWMRPRGEIGDDPRLHEALRVYASDRTLLGTLSQRHALAPGERMGASLDHAMWLHRPARFDGWVLYVSESPVAHAARGLILAGMYAGDGTRLASVAQEGLVRTRRAD
jgi:acyl-CoA thioesterase-2